MEFIHLNEYSVKNSYSYRRNLTGVILFTVATVFTVSALLFALSLGAALFIIMTLVLALFSIFGLIMCVVWKGKIANNPEDYCAYNAKIESITIKPGYHSEYKIDCSANVYCDLVFEDETGKVIRKKQRFKTKYNGVQMMTDDTAEMLVAYDSKRDRFIIIDALPFE